MALRELTVASRKFVIDNSPLLLTTVGVVGTVTTAYLTGKASILAYQDYLDWDEEFAWHAARKTPGSIDGGVSRGIKPIVNLVWKRYIPPAIAGSITIAAIVGANRIGTRRAAALAAAYSLSEKAWEEYKEQVIKQVGTNEARKIEDKTAQALADKSEAKSSEIIVISGDVICHEAYTGRYFSSSNEELKKAQNDLNYQILNDGYASLSDFYDLVGLPHTALSEEVGWTSDKLLEIHFSTIMSDDGKPCISINYQVEPVRDYYKFRY